MLKVVTFNTAVIARIVDESFGIDGINISLLFDE